MRLYKVDTYGWNKTADADLVGKIAEFRVTDAEKGEDEKQRPPVATFHVSVLYDTGTQKIRAEKLAEYLNDVNSKIGMYEILKGSAMS